MSEVALEAPAVGMNKRLPISVCMISGAEANRIGRALESVAAWAGEIIVVLNEETQDGTEEIAMRHGARVFREPWTGFIQQKNFCAAGAQQPWILNLDADEVVSDELAAELAIVTGRSDGPVAYEFPRCTFYCGRWIRHGDWYPDRVLRLWRRGSARWAGLEPHAKLEVTGSIGRLRSDLLHYTNESIAHHISKIVPYTEDFVRRQAALPGRMKFSKFQMLCRPGWRFFRSFVLKLGFLDGWQGCYIAWAAAFSTATKYARAREAIVSRK